MRTTTEKTISQQPTSGEAKANRKQVLDEIARKLLGPDWLPNYVQHATRGGIERVLV